MGGRNDHYEFGDRYKSIYGKKDDKQCFTPIEGTSDRLETIMQKLLELENKIDEIGHMAKHLSYK